MTNHRTVRTSASGDLTLVGDEDDDRALVDLEVSLRIDAPRRDLIAQPDKFYRAALREARLRADYERNERQLMLTEARVLDDLREAASRRDDPMSDTKLVARARVHAEVEAARRLAGASRRKLALAEALCRAYEMRHAALIALVTSK